MSLKFIEDKIMSRIAKFERLLDYLI